MCSLSCTGVGVALPCRLSNTVKIIFPGLRRQCYASIPSRWGLSIIPGRTFWRAIPRWLLSFSKTQGGKKIRGQNRTLCAVKLTASAWSREQGHWWRSQSHAVPTHCIARTRTRTRLHKGYKCPKAYAVHVRWVRSRVRQPITQYFLRFVESGHAASPPGSPITSTK